VVVVVVLVAVVVVLPPTVEASVPSRDPRLPSKYNTPFFPLLHYPVVVIR
jgi:hypothetical protein